MVNSELKDSETIPMDQTYNNKISPELGNPPLPGAKELGEKMEATLLEMAETTLKVKEAREKAQKETFNQRNLANQEWQLLNARGEEERQVDDLKTNRELTQIAQLTMSSVQRNKTELELYTKETKRQIAENAAKNKIKRKQMIEMSETSVHQKIEEQRLFKNLRSQELSDFKNENLQEAEALKLESQTAIREMEEIHRSEIEEIRRKEQQKLEEELHRQKEQQFLLIELCQKKAQVQKLEDVKDASKQHHQNLQYDINIEPERGMPYLSLEKISEKESGKEESETEENHQKRLREIRRQAQTGVEKERRQRDLKHKVTVEILCVAS